jgi:hypothetical protein
LGIDLFDLPKLLRGLVIEAGGEECPGDVVINPCGAGPEGEVAILTLLVERFSCLSRTAKQKQSPSTIREKVAEDVLVHSSLLARCALQLQTDIG